MPRFAPALFAALWVAGPAAAHPGHGIPAEAWSAAHLLGEPLHVLLPLAALIGAGIATTLARRFRRGRA
jgi:hypothetical protein